MKLSLTGQRPAVRRAVTRSVITRAGLAACVAGVLTAAGAQTVLAKQRLDLARHSKVGLTAHHSGGAMAKKATNIAFFSFAIQNPFDAAMLSALKREARANGVTLTVFDGNNNPQTQYSQMQDAIATGKYNGFLVQAVDGAGLVSLVKQAISKHIQVAAVNQVLGPNLATAKPQVPGLAASVVLDTKLEGQVTGQLVVQACASLKLASCQVGYMYDIKASGFDQGVRNGFNQAIAHHPSIKVVAEGQDEFSPSGGLQAAQTMLASAPGLNVIVGSDQGMAGAEQAIKATGKKILIVGNGGSVEGINNVKAGQWFGDFIVEPVSEGQAALTDLIRAVRTGKHSGGLAVEATLPAKGRVTKQNAHLFKGQWTA